MRTLVDRLYRLALVLLSVCMPMAASAGLIPTITLAGLPGSTVPGFPLTVIAGVFGIPGPATGSVAFELRNASTGSVSSICGATGLDGAGNGSCAFVTPAAGIWRIEVYYLGDPSYDPANGTFAFSTAQVTPSISLTGLPASTVPGVTLPMVARISSGSPLGNPTGSATFLMRSLATGSAFNMCNATGVDGNGDAYCTIVAPGNGSYQIEVQYSGDAPNAALMQSFPFTSQQVTPSISLTGLPASTVPGVTLPMVARISSGSPLGNPTGSATFLMRSLATGSAFNMCNATGVDGNGDAYCTIVAPGNGSYQIEVQYSGDAPNAALLQSFPFTAQQVTPSISLTGLPASTVPGATLSMVARVSSASPLGNPTGSATFVLRNLSTNGTSTVCNATGLDGNGDAGCTIAAPGNGSWRIEVTYSGDTPNAPFTDNFPFSVSSAPVVTNTADSGPGSLRDAISFVNGNCAGQAITFNIAPAGVPQTIMPTSPLPTLTCAGMAIDGYSQPGASMNTQAVGSDATLLVAIDGTFIPATRGIEIAAGDITVKGLAIHSFNSSGAGVIISAPLGTPNIVVAGNYIGTDTSGGVARPNTVGVINTAGATGLLIGGPSPAHRNVIGSNDTNIHLQSGNSSFVTHNYIGVGSSGMFEFGGTSWGVLIDGGAANTRIGSDGSDGNVIAGAVYPVYVQNVAGTLIRGNSIGTNATETGVLGTFWGVGLFNASGTAIDANVIGGSGSYGINASMSNGTAITGNFIGVNDNGTVALPNAQGGIVLDSSISTIDGNVIANSGGNGVDLVNTNQTPITGNTMYGNALRGINLIPAGSVPANDACDTDVGNNSQQNYPDLATAQTNGSVVTITGTLTSSPSRNFRLHFYASPASDDAGFRGGRTLLGLMVVAIDGSCVAPINAAFLVAVPLGHTITATATDLNTNETGWFSNAVTVTPPGGAPAVSLSTSSLAFSPLLLGGTSPPQTVTLTNTGSASLDISSVGAGAPFFVANGCPALLAAGASCNLDVTFAPTAKGTPTGALAIATNAAGSPHTVSLTGMAVAPPTFQLATFASRTPGQVSTMTVFITNTSGNPVSYGGFAVQLDYPAGGFVHDTSRPVQTSCDSSVFTVGNPVTGIGASGGSVPAGVGCTVVSSQFFVPTTPGTYTFTIPAGGFTITSPFPYSNPSPITATVNVTLAPAPGVSLAPASLAFGAQTIGTTSGAQQVTLTNTGSAPLTISSVSAGPEFTLSSCASPLAAGASCTIAVTFSPTATGPVSSAITLTTNAPGSPHSVALSGTGVDVPVPGVSLTPSALTFASRTVSTRSPPQSVTLANSGTAALNIASITVAGDFAFTSDCPAQVAAGATCTIDVTFTPLVPGARAGSIAVASDAGGSPHVVALSGTGLSALAPVLDVSPLALDFAPQALGSDSTPQLVTVRNAGTATLAFVSIGVSGDFRQVALPAGGTATACPVSLAPGAACDIAIVFHPLALNLRTGTLVITAGGSTVSVTLAGTGLTPSVPQLSMPSSLAFGNQPIGTASTGRPLAIRNTSSSLATITELTASGDFSVSDTCATIAAGATCSPLVSFQPSALGARTGTLTVRTLRDAAPYLVTLTGTGEENRIAALELSATRLGFGNAFVGSATRVRTVLRNIGQVPVLIDSILATGKYIVTHGCTSIAAGSSCTLDITFLPGGSGTQAGSIEIRSNAAGSPHMIEVSGIGCFVPSPSRARFGLLLCGP